MTKCVGDVLREYFALRKEMLSVINSPEAPGEAHVRLVHSLVARMEGRLAVMLTTRDDELREDQRRIGEMVERLVQLYLVHTPEVPEELRAGALATYANFRKAVADGVAGTDSYDADGRPQRRPGE
jgi:hypothetical protein